MRISDWSSDVCSSDLADHPVLDGELVLRHAEHLRRLLDERLARCRRGLAYLNAGDLDRQAAPGRALVRRQHGVALDRSEEHTSELQSLMRISYAVFCLKKKTLNNN